MDFAFTQEQEALRELAHEILADHVTQERLKLVESGTEWFDREVWGALAQANLIGLGFAEEYGGSGLSLFEVAIVLEQVGRHVAPIPYLATVVMGGMPVERFGNDEQRHRLLLPVTTGDAVLTAALIEPAGDDLMDPATTATKDGAHWRLDGTKIAVPAAHVAERIVVPATTAAGKVGFFLVDPHAKGVDLQREKATSGERMSLLVLTGAMVEERDVLGDPVAGREMLTWTVERTLAGLCAIELGVAAEALRMTAEYTSKREQFGKPVGGPRGCWRKTCRRPRKCGSPSSGRPRAGIASPTRRSTCTAASASTSTTRCTATTPGRSRSSSRWARRTRSSSSWAR